MSDGVSNTVVLALFLLVTTLSFYYLLDTWGAQNAVTEESVDRQLARLSTSISIQSTDDAGSDCKTFSTQIENNGDTLVADYTEMDVLVQYTNTSNTWIVSRLAYPTDWAIALSPDDRDPKIWNPDETAAITFTLGSALKGDILGTVLVGTPQGILDSSYFRCVCTAGDTGFLDPAAQSADTGGGGDGFELDPTNAFADDAAFASNIGGDGDQHRYYDYGFSIKSSCDVSGIELRLDWWLDSLGGNNKMDVELSWDGGTSWTAAKSDTVESDTEHTTILGGPTDDWGRTWSATEFSDSNFRARLTTDGVGGRNYFLDWVPVKVHYDPP